MPDPKKENPPAIQGGGFKDEKGNYHAKHTNLEVGSSTNIGHKAKHAKGTVVDIKTKKKK